MTALSFGAVGQGGQCLTAMMNLDIVSQEIGAKARGQGEERGERDEISHRVNIL